MLIREADALLKNGSFELAAHGYAKVARFYEGSGFALKATALWKMVRQVIDGHQVRASHLDREAKGRLIELYRSLGMEADVRALEDEGPFS